MMTALLQHVLRRALRSLWENLYLNAMASGVIAAALLLLGVVVSVERNLDRIIDSWDRDVHVSAYFHDDVPEDRRFALRDELATKDEVAKIRYVSEEEARQWMVERVEGVAGVLEEVGPGTLPASLEITLAPSATDAPGGIAAFAASLGTTDFEDVDYGQEWVERFNSFLRLLGLMGAVVAGIVVVAALFLVANTVDLVVFNRRAELEIQRLVGATWSFIAAPFAIEGLIQGLVGAGIAVIGLYAVHHLVVLRLQTALQLGLAGELTVLEPAAIAVLVVSGAVLGVAAALASVARFLWRTA